MKFQRAFIDIKNKHKRVFLFVGTFHGTTLHIIIILSWYKKRQRNGWHLTIANNDSIRVNQHIGNLSINKQSIVYTGSPI